MRKTDSEEENKGRKIVRQTKIIKKEKENQGGGIMESTRDTHL